MSLRKVSLLGLAAFFFAGCGDQYMLKSETSPTITADPAKATLIIYRSTSFGFAKEIYNYLDQSYIGTTRGKCYFVTKVEPGTHYVIADAENKACAKVNFEPNKVYFLSQGIFPGVMSARTGFSGSNPPDFEGQKPELDFVVCNPKQESPTLDEGDYKETVADFEKENSSDPKKHEDTNNLQGF